MSDLMTALARGSHKGRDAGEGAAEPATPEKAGDDAEWTVGLVVEQGGNWSARRVAVTRNAARLHSGIGFSLHRIPRLALTYNPTTQPAEKHVH